MGVIRVLFLADTHLGFDLPFRPRIERRRRGPEFFANFKRALQPALDDRVDCVVHGGDLLYRSKVPPKLVEMAFEPLKRVADLGIPVYMVPGNHERSAIPHRHLGNHPRIHIFDKPHTFRLQKENFSLALAGFPFVRQGIRHKFLNLIGQTGCYEENADIHLLCIHQAVDGAAVGPAEYMFSRAPDVIDTSQIPGKFDAVLAGHIHRCQVLSKDLKSRILPAPIYYAGSTDRTSFAEKADRKGYLILEFDSVASTGVVSVQWRFHQLPVRPMIQLDLHASNMNNAELRSWIETRIWELPEDSIVRIKIHDAVAQHAMEVLSAPSLRTIAPKTMNVDAVFTAATRTRAVRRRTGLSTRKAEP